MESGRVSSKFILMLPPLLDNRSDLSGRPWFSNVELLFDIFSVKRMYLLCPVSEEAWALCTPNRRIAKNNGNSFIKEQEMIRIMVFRKNITFFQKSKALKHP